MDDKVTLKVATPAGIYEGTFEGTVKVHEVIAAIVKEKGLAEGDGFELVPECKALAPDRELETIHVEDITVFDLIATGSGV